MPKFKRKNRNPQKCTAVLYLEKYKCDLANSSPGTDITNGHVLHHFTQCSSEDLTIKAFSDLVIDLVSDQSLQNSVSAVIQTFESQLKTQAPTTKGMKKLQEFTDCKFGQICHSLLTRPTNTSSSKCDSLPGTAPARIKVMMTMT